MVTGTSTDSAAVFNPFQKPPLKTDPRKAALVGEGGFPLTCPTPSPPRGPGAREAGVPDPAIPFPGSLAVCDLGRVPNLSVLSSLTRNTKRHRVPVLPPLSEVFLAVFFWSLSEPRQLRLAFVFGKDCAFSLTRRGVRAFEVTEGYWIQCCR